MPPSRPFVSRRSLAAARRSSAAKMLRFARRTASPTPRRWWAPLGRSQGRHPWHKRSTASLSSRVLSTCRSDAHDRRGPSHRPHPHRHRQCTYRPAEKLAAMFVRGRHAGRTHKAQEPEPSYLRAHAAPSRVGLGTALRTIAHNNKGLWRAPSSCSRASRQQSDLLLPTGLLAASCDPESEHST